jgi:PST family polysaccharide transporter
MNFSLFSIYRKLPEDFKYFFSGSFFLGLSSIFSLIVPLIIIPYLIKIVGLSGYGLSVVAFSVMYFLSLIIDFGYVVSGVNMLSKSSSKVEKGKIIVYAIYTKAVLFLVLLICFILSVVFVPYLREHYILYSYSFLITFSSVFNLNWILQGLQKIKILSIVSVLSKTIYLIGILLFVNEKSDYVLINLIFALGILVSGIFSFYIIKKEIPLPLIPYNLRKFSEEIRASGYYFVSNISIYLSSSVYPVILNFFVSSEMIGVFSIVEKIYNLLRAIFSIYLNLMLPRVSSLVESSISKGTSQLKKTYIFIIVFVLLEIIVAWVFKYDIVLFFTKEFVPLTTSLLEVSLVGVLIVILNCPFYLMLLALDEKKVVMKTTIIGGFTGLILCSVLSLYFGISGAIYSMIATELFYSLTYVIIFFKIIKRK